MDGQKEFKREGVGITANGVSALVHFILRRNKEVSAEEVSDDEENLLSMDRLSLTPVHIDEDNDQNDGGMENILSLDRLSLTPVDNDDIDVHDDEGKQRYFSVIIHNKLFTHFIRSVAANFIAAEHPPNTVEMSTDPGLSNILTVQMFRNGRYKKTFFLTRRQYYQDSRNGWAGIRVGQ